MKNLHILSFQVFIFVAYFTGISFLNLQIFDPNFFHSFAKFN